ncbi:hypothetical protein ACWDV4_09920 [Micromonospora sp. NPDC003197]
MNRVLRILAVGAVTLTALVGCRESNVDPAGAAKVSPGATDPSQVAEAAGLGSGAGSGGLDPNTSNVAATGGPTTAPSGSTTGAKPFPTGGAEVVRTAVPVEDYHALFNQAVAAKYRPTWLDGYDVAGRTYFNVVFRPDKGAAWYEYTEMSASGYQSRHDTLKAKGFTPVFVESYLHGGQVRYAAIWEKGAAEYYAFHGLTADAMQTNFDAKVKAGFTPAQVSGVTVGGKTVFTGLMTKRSLGKSWAIRSNLTPATYQKLFNELTAKGMGPAYVNAYTVDGAVRFVATFAATANTPYQARHNLSASALASQQATHTKAGYRTRAIAGYDSNGSAAFIAIWAK